MDALIPADRIFEPLLLREAQRGFDLRADVGFADAFVQIRHEHDGGNLLDERAVAGIDVRPVQSSACRGGPRARAPARVRERNTSASSASTAAALASHGVCRTSAWRFGGHWGGTGEQKRRVDHDDGSPRGWRTFRPAGTLLSDACVKRRSA